MASSSLPSRRSGFGGSSIGRGFPRRRFELVSRWVASGRKQSTTLPFLATLGRISGGRHSIPFGGGRVWGSFGTVCGIGPRYRVCPRRWLRRSSSLTITFVLDCTGSSTIRRIWRVPSSSRRSRRRRWPPSTGSATSSAPRSRWDEGRGSTFSIERSFRTPSVFSTLP